MPKSILAPHEFAFVMSFLAGLLREEKPETVHTVSKMAADQLQMGPQGANAVLADLVSNELLIKASCIWGNLMEATVRLTGGNNDRAALILTAISEELTVYEEEELRKKRAAEALEKKRSEILGP